MAQCPFPRTLILSEACDVGRALLGRDRTYSRGVSFFSSQYCTSHCRHHDHRVVVLSGGCAHVSADPRGRADDTRACGPAAALPLHESATLYCCTSQSEHYARPTITYPA